jgi:alpha-beta hydrolase superfamily lysophospholipase
LALSNAREPKLRTQVGQVQDRYVQGSRKIHNRVTAIFARIFGYVSCALMCSTFCALPVFATDSDSALERYAVVLSGHPIVIWSRRPPSPAGVVVLVHGRTWGARTAFDFEPKGGNRSLLKVLAAAGYATYAVDLPGYGETARDGAGWLKPTHAAEVVEAVLGFASTRNPRLPAPVLLGWSRGSKISALVATRARQPLSGLVLYAFTFDRNSPPLYGPATGDPKAIANSEADAQSDFISPDVVDANLVQEFVKTALKLDPVKVDVCCDTDFLEIRPEAIHVPTLLIQGARDPGIHPAAAAEFFSKLSTNDRRWVVIAEGDHAVGLEATAHIFFGAVVDFVRSTITPKSAAR